MEYESAFSGSGIWCCRKSQVWLAGATNAHAKHQSTFSQAYLYPSCIPRPPVYTLIFPRSPACFSSLRSLEASQVSVCPTSNFCHESFRVTLYYLFAQLPSDSSLTSSLPSILPHFHLCFLRNISHTSTASEH